MSGTWNFGRLAVGLAGLAAAAGLAWEWNRLARESARLRATLVAQETERARLTAEGFAGGLDGSEWRDAIARAVEMRDARRIALLGRGSASPAPESPLALWFEIAGMGERLRAAAAHAGVRTEPGEHFGFATHRAEPPPAATAGQVARQRRVVETVVRLLLAAQPEALLAVQREQPADDRAAASDPADYFVREEAANAAQDGLVSSTAVRLEFSGTTAVLRAFLNALAAAEEPLVVRSVAVKPMADDALPTAGQGAGRRPGGPVPIVRAAPSRFAVVVEHLAEPAT